jgi:hypothetical protein
MASFWILVLLPCEKKLLFSLETMPPAFENIVLSASDQLLKISDSEMFCFFT